ncbi:ribonuclease [Eubacterium maltosivorans]|uniref:ribonuclease domain-containing protein n=1 Tax=Eubacterium maltosivorans TaxID=2041044 RepID=UPI00087EA2E4|nr:ribonuclease domain-containing protein [Eubacterium maltosivorans]WPK80171.1 Ribonuclease [Eubacterium maltosivorans]SDO83257.1 ribonuclease [Eubacterium maltosivorans]
MLKRLFKTLLPLLMVALLITGCGSTLPTGTDITGGSVSQIAENGAYTSKEDVALYIHTYQKLPSNFITKKEAQKLGWDSQKGNLDKVAKGKSIGGDRFGNYDKKLPEAKGRTWKECDINYEGGYRGAERIIYSSDGLIYYTNDHYNSFEEIIF